MTTIRLILSAFLIVFLIIFAYFNLNPAVFRLFDLSIEAPLFLLLLSAFALGLATAFGYSQLKGATLSGFASGVREGLRHLGLGYYRKAESRFSKLSYREEVIPLLWESLKREGKELSIYLERYGEGIAETILAESVVDKDRRRAIDLLEKALGKNFSNLRARRLLRSLYFLEGELERALEIQRTLIKESERQERGKERVIYNEMLTFREKENLPKEFERSKEIHILATAVIIERGGGKSLRQAIRNAFSKGMQDDLILFLLERDMLTAEVLEAVSEREGEIGTDTLALLYLSIGRIERAKELEDNLSEPIKLIVRETERRRDLLKELARAVKLWKCNLCGAEYNNYTPLCCKCFEWNSITTKGGFRDACGFRYENDQG